MSMETLPKDSDWRKWNTKSKPCWTQAILNIVLTISITEFQAKAWVVARTPNITFCRETTSSSCHAISTTFFSPFGILPFSLTLPSPGNVFTSTNRFPIANSIISSRAPSCFCCYNPRATLSSSNATLLYADRLNLIPTLPSVSRSCNFQRNIIKFCLYTTYAYFCKQKNDRILLFLYEP